jgi:hypothetical protein
MLVRAPEVPVKTGNVTASTVQVPKEQLPVGAGEEKISKFESRMRGLVEKLTPDEAKEFGFSTYKVSNQAENIEKALTRFKGKEDEAVRILNGEAPMPKDLDVETNALLIAMMDDAKKTGNEVLARKLATSTRIRSLAATRAGQEISILQKADPDSPVTAMADIITAREARATRVHKDVVKKVKEVATDAQKTVASQKIKLEKANELINSLLC